MHALLSLAPVWLAFEILQLVLSERLLGLKQIQSSDDPRATRPGPLLASAWLLAILLYAAWTLSLLFIHGARAQAFGLIAITAIGYALRSNATLKWILVILTFEGSLRVGMLVSLSAAFLRN